MPLIIDALTEMAGTVNRCPAWADLVNVDRLAIAAQFSRLEKQHLCDNVTGIVAAHLSLLPRDALASVPLARPASIAKRKEAKAASSLSQRALTDLVGLSQNVCWRRLNRLQSEVIIRGQRAELNLARLGLDLVVMVVIKLPHRPKEWALAFKAHVETLPGVVDLYWVAHRPRS